jgi:predicted AAA+ superfamily ATPase
MKFVERSITPKLKELAEKFPVVFLSGPGKSGKSTLLKSLFHRTHEYVSLAEKENRDFALNDPKGFLNALRGRVVIDDVHIAPALIPHIRSKIDGNDALGMYILAGRLDSSMKKNISVSLKGLAVKLSLLPFSVAELLSAKKVPKETNEWLFKGAYPELFHSGINPKDFYNDYLASLFDQDVRPQVKAHKLNKFKRFLAIAALNSGNPINLSKLGGEASIDSRTANSWLSLLEEKYIIFKLLPRTTNSATQSLKTPKLYFYDSGLLCAILGISGAGELNFHRMRNSIFETAIVSDHFKNCFNSGYLPKLYYWRNLDKRERKIDIIEESSTGIKLAEIKFSETANEEYAKELLNFETSKKIIARRVIYDGEDDPGFSGVPYVNWRAI